MLVDLFGLEYAPVRRPNRKLEADAQVEVLKALRAHPGVSWVERINSGAARIGKRFIRFGFPGCPDVLGQLHDGRLIGVECKAPGGRLRPEQKIVLERIREAGGVAFVAGNCLDVFHELNQLKNNR
jgi:hypothetical protein